MSRFDTSRWASTGVVDTIVHLNPSVANKVLISWGFVSHPRQLGLAWSVLLSTSENAMLKITAVDGDEQQTLVLEGALVEPWVIELERSWAEAQQGNRARTVLVDLKDVTAISQRGENLLYEMMTGGATLQCCRGVLTKLVLRQLERRREMQSGKDRDQL